MSDPEIPPGPTPDPPSPPESPAAMAPHDPRRDVFGGIAAWTARAAGSRWAALAAFGTVAAWAILGPAFGYSDQWQLVINTGTTIVTFLMVFLIQNAQNRESKAVHLKLDELILAVKHARNELIDVESLTEGQLDRLAVRYREIAARHHEELEESLEQVDRRVESVAGAVGELERRTLTTGGGPAS